MAELASKRMNADEFIAWAIEQPEGCHYELDDGEVVAMAPDRLAHGIVKGIFFRRMADEIERLNLDGMALTDGMAVRVDEHTVYEPDALLRCGPKLAYDTVALDDPLVVIEIRSRSTSYRDTGIKLIDYFRLPSVRHYLVVKIEGRVVIHHRRNADDTINTSIVRDGPVLLDPPGIVLRDLFPADIG